MAEQGLDNPVGVIQELGVLNEAVVDEATWVDPVLEKVRAKASYPADAVVQKGQEGPTELLTTAEFLAIQCLVNPAILQYRDLDLVDHISALSVFVELDTHLVWIWEECGVVVAVKGLPVTVFTSCLG